MKHELLRLKGITKSIGGNNILDNFDLSMFTGEILFLFGLSSSGIDEIIEIIIGNLEYDSGSIQFSMESNLKNSLFISQKNRIYYIREYGSLVPEFTVAENLNIFENQHRKRGLINKNKIEKKAKKILSDLGLGISPSALCGSLSVFEQMLIEIIRCDQMGIRLIITNDFNMNFSLEEYGVLNKTMEHMSKKGMSFLICMHSYNEWCELFPSAQRFIIMRNGQKVCTIFSDDYNKSDVVSLMTGREYSKGYIRKQATKGEPYLEVSRLQNDSGIQDITFEVCSGEIIGLLDLSGKTNAELASLLSGTKSDYRGIVRLSGRKIIIKNTKQAVKNGIGYISGNSAYASILPDSMTVAENLSLLLIRKRLLNRMLIDKKRINIVYNENCEELGLAGVSPNVTIEKIDAEAKLRLIYMRWILAKPKVLICLNPTYKLDMMMKNTVYQMLDKAAKSGIGVLFLSSDPAAAATICDRLAVLSDGQIKGFFNKKDMEKIGSSLL